VEFAQTGLGPVIVQGKIELTTTSTEHVVVQVASDFLVTVTVNVMVCPWSVIAAVYTGL
jgi:hypothetical protein